MKIFPLNARTKDRLASMARFIVVIPMIIIGNVVRLYVQEVWAEYWLVKDARPTRALITQAHPKRVFDYSYSVNGKEYTGNSHRDWEDEKVHALQVGEETTVFFSASHPGLSSLQTFRFRWAGFPFILLLLLFEIFFLAVLIDPGGRWRVSRWFLGSSGEPHN